MSYPFEISLFGSCQIHSGGVRLQSRRSRKGIFLLALLALQNGRALERDYLAELFWPDSDPEHSHYNLRQVVMELRRMLLDQGYRISSPTARTLHLDLDGAFVDVLAFDAAIRKADDAALSEAIALYRGPLLEDCTEEWANEAREVRRQDYFQALETRAQHYLDGAEPAEAVRCLRLLVVADPWRESAYRSLMQAFSANGEPAAITALYRDLRRMLLQDLSVEPAQETKELYERLRIDSPSLKPSLAPAPEVPTPSAVAGSHREPVPVAGPLSHEAVGGAMPPGSPYYVVRPADGRFTRALSAGEGIVLVKGARQIGKTSMLARGLHELRPKGKRIVLTDFRAFTAVQLETQENLFRALAQDLAHQLELEVKPSAAWDSESSVNMNLEYYLRRYALAQEDGPLVWAFDESDALFSYSYSSNMFGLFRSWFNRRALDPNGPWQRLTMVLVYAREAHMFITNRNLSPFNVGTEVALDDFTVEQVAELNERHGSPLQGAEEVARYHRLLNGHPYLTRLGLRVMREEGLPLQVMEESADRDSSPFGAHLRQMMADLVRDSALTDTVRSVLRGLPCGTPQEFYHLRSAGIFSGENMQQPGFRCPVYRSYLQQSLLGSA